MSSEEKQIIGSVRSQDLSVSWISEQGRRGKNSDRVCILMMANGQIRLTMQSETLNLKGMRLTKGHMCVLALFEAIDPKYGEAADKASEMFMNMLMKYDITKKQAKDVLKKCLSKVDKKISKDIKDAGFKASVAAFAAKEMTVCSVRGGRMFILSDDNKMNEFVSEDIEISCIGNEWKDVMMISAGYNVVIDEIKDDMRSPAGDLITKREMRMQHDASSFIRASKI